jgi:hypothetical protein
MNVPTAPQLPPQYQRSGLVGGQARSALRRSRVWALAAGAAYGQLMSWVTGWLTGSGGGQEVAWIAMGVLLVVIASMSMMELPVALWGKRLAALAALATYPMAQAGQRLVRQAHVRHLGYAHAAGASWVLFFLAGRWAVGLSPVQPISHFVTQLLIDPWGWAGQWHTLAAHWVWGSDFLIFMLKLFWLGEAALALWFTTAACAKVVMNEPYSETTGQWAQKTFTGHVDATTLPSDDPARALLNELPAEHTWAVLKRRAMQGPLTHHHLAMAIEVTGWAVPQDPRARWLDLHVISWEDGAFWKHRTPVFTGWAVSAADFDAVQQHLQ